MTPDELRDRLWQVIADVRDAAPRRPDDADTDDVTDAAMVVVRDVIAAELDALENGIRYQLPGYVGRIDTADTVRDRADRWRQP